MKKVYRISDKANLVLIQGVTRRHCVKNLVDEFGTDETVVIADNVTEETSEFLETPGVSRDIYPRHATWKRRLSQAG